MKKRTLATKTKAMTRNTSADDQHRGGLLFCARTEYEQKEEKTPDGGTSFSLKEEFKLYMKPDNEQCAIDLGTLSERPFEVFYHNNSVWLLDTAGILRLSDRQRIPQRANSFLMLEDRLCALSQKQGLFDVCTGEQHISPEQISEDAKREGLSFIGDACLHDERIIILGGHEKEGRYGYTIEYFTLEKKKGRWNLQHIGTHPGGSAVAEPFCGSDATPDHNCIVRSIDGKLFSRNAWCGPVYVQETPEGKVLSEIRAADCVTGITYESKSRQLYLSSTGNRDFAEAIILPTSLKPQERVSTWNAAFPLDDYEIMSRVSLEPREHTSNYRVIQGTLCRVDAEQAEKILQKHSTEPYQRGLPL